MPLSDGTRLGPYEILAALGEGGMGEVYRARDTKLGRIVAVKVLPDAMASDPDRIARFAREAKALAALNHPRIATLYGMDEAAGRPFLVMELVDGETLAVRLNRGPLPPGEALTTAIQIAEALAAAHLAGIIHRDLKPGNVMITKDGAKLLDFGLAKASEPAVSRVAASFLSTTPPALTEPGTILGTFQYMAPEQIEGQDADARTDLFAFGCVIYETLTGRKAFEGRTKASVIAAIMHVEPPPVSAIQPITPRALDRVMKKCLAKDPNDRWQSARDLSDELKWIAESGVAEATRLITEAPYARASGWRRVLPWALVGASLACAAVAVWVPRRTIAPAQTLRLSVALGPDVSLARNVGNTVVLSPDGAVLAFVAHSSAGESPRLYVRRLNQLTAMPLAGTDGAEGPFFSPDGQWLGFFSGGKLKKIAVAGSAVVTLCDAPGHRGGAWAEDGTIVFSYAGPGVGLLSVSSAGGTPGTLSSLAEGEVTQRWPQVLPGGKAVLYTGHSETADFHDANLVVQSLPTGDRKIVLRGGSHGRYVPSGLGSPERSAREGGHLLYVRSGALFAAPFDIDRLEVTGQPVPTLEGIESDTATGDAQFAVSTTGTLLYLSGQSTSVGTPIHWMHQDGTTPLRPVPANWFEPRFAPDGGRLAVRIIDAHSAIWVYDWARDTLSPVTAGGSGWPVWTANGHGIVFASRPPGKTTPNLYWQRADGTGDAERLTESNNLQLPRSWHPSGKFLAFFELTSQDNDDLMILPMEGDDKSGWKAGKATVFLNSPFREREPMFSPDGRWLAYESNESGRSEVWVRPFPGPGGKWMVSAGGGVSPTWSRTKRELFYGTDGKIGQIMVVPYVVQGGSFHAEKPRLWSDRRYVTDRGFDLHPDGDRVALATAAPVQDGAKQDRVVLILNFFDELRRIAPVKQ